MPCTEFLTDSVNINDCTTTDKTINRFSAEGELTGNWSSYGNGETDLCNSRVTHCKEFDVGQDLCSPYTTKLTD